MKEKKALSDFKNSYTLKFDSSLFSMFTSLAIFCQTVFYSNIN